MFKTVNISKPIYDKTKTVNVIVSTAIRCFIQENLLLKLNTGILISSRKYKSYYKLIIRRAKHTCFRQLRIKCISQYLKIQTGVAESFQNNLCTILCQSRITFITFMQPDPFICRPDVSY